MSRCHHCPAHIVWARTAAGKLMPLDANSDDTIRADPSGNIAARVDGAQISARVIGEDLLSGPDLEDGEVRAMPHFATCPGWGR